MEAAIIPFPSSRRYGLAERITPRGEKYVAHYLRQHRAHLIRLGIASERIDREMAELESMLAPAPQKVHA
jgi:hypothetical protein